MEILRTEHLSKVYGEDEVKVHALRDISLSVYKGEFVAIIGPSGSGKSTFMHLIGGVDHPSNGKVYVDGTDLYQLNETQLAIFRRRQIGLIYQFYNLLPTLTVEENITLPVLLDGHRVDQEQFQAIVKTLGLQDRMNYLPNQLSGGQQQRVSIGRAIMTNPTLILADEPTGNLDSKNSQEIIHLLKMFNRTYQQTVIMITHDERIALEADRIITFMDGQVLNDEVVRP